MASTAKNTSKKTRTYASAVAGVAEKSIFSTLAKCQLKSPRNMPHARIPNTKEQHSFFIDLMSTDASEEEVLAALTLDGIVGAHSRDDLWVVELICKNDAVVEAAMNTTFTIEGKKSVEAIMPRHKTNPHSLIKIANVPFGNRKELTEKLSNYWAQYGTVIDTAPYMFPGKPWLTKRWDLLLELNEGVNKLTAPPIFNIEGYEDILVCSWTGAKKACLRCKSAGHSSSKCPTLKPKGRKNGESANPLQKIGRVGQSQNRQKKESNVSPASAEKPTSETVSATATKQPAPDDSSSFMDVEATEAQIESETAESSAPTSAEADAAAKQDIAERANRILQLFDTYEAYAIECPPVDPQLQQLYLDIGRNHYASGRNTPPNFIQTQMADPDTPRKGKKRQAKDDIWTPMLKQVRNRLLKLKLCVGCWGKGHLISHCDKGKRGSLTEENLGSVLRHPMFQPILAAWSHARQQEGAPWRLDDGEVEVEVEVAIPPFCTKCHRPGHVASNCSAKLTCTHCKGNHLRIDCITAPPYAYEQ
jgi:hypothetical protein